MHRLLCILGFALATLGIAHGEEADRLETLLGAEDYRAMGLAKLAPEERERLRRWLLQRLDGKPVPMPAPAVSYSVTPPAGTTADGAPLPQEGPVSISFVARPSQPAATTTVAAPTPADAAAAFGLEQTGEGPREFRARVVGQFTGWSGKTEFTLDNGQVWRQSTSGVYQHKAVDPEVVIERSLIGYKLRLVETRRSVSVRRIK